MKPADIPTIKMTYAQLGNFGVAQTLQKIASTPTSNKNACHIHRITKEVQKAREMIVKEFQTEIVEKFGKRDAGGKIIRPADQPKGYEPIEGKEAEMDEAFKAFDAKTITFNCRPLTPSVLADIKISAQEIDALGELFTETEGPGIPTDIATKLGVVN